MCTAWLHAEGVRRAGSQQTEAIFPCPTAHHFLSPYWHFDINILLITLGFWTVKLNPNASRLCTIVPPWGKCEYLCLPMGLSNAPDIFQEAMHELLSDLEFIKACIDDVIAFTKGSWEDHLSELETVLQLPQRSGLKINAKKSFSEKQKLNTLGTM